VATRRPANFVAVWLYALIAAGLLWLPLLRTLHAESSAVIATVAFFVAGLDSVREFRLGERRVVRLIGRQWLYLLVPLAVFLFARFWLPSCDFWAGAWFYLLFPGVTVVFAVSLAFFLTGFQRISASIWLTVIGIVILTVPVLYDLGFHPQFYVYNHIFGGVLGPIYDFELSSRNGLYWHRLLTICWSGLLVLIGHQLREPSRGAIPGSVTFLVLIILLYSNGAKLGLNTSYGRLASQLGSQVETEHFVIHYDSSTVSDNEIRRIADDHEFRYRQLERRLGFTSEFPVHTYIYPSAEVRSELTGAGRTNIAPVWLDRPQIHVTFDTYEWSFAHELAHVFSREFGIPVIRASLHVGLVEGFAVAMEPPMGLPSPDEQVAAVLRSALSKGVYESKSVASAVAASLSPSGFWTGRGAVSYTTMGSFVDFLIREYGIQAFARVYAMEGFDAVYGRSVLELARQWERSLAELDTSPGALELAAARFSVPSLFERECPRDIPPAYDLFRRGRRALALGDSSTAVKLLERSLEEAPGLAEVASEWAALKLAGGSHDEVASRLSSLWIRDPSTKNGLLALSLGDSFSLSGAVDEAGAVYLEGLEVTSPFSRSLRAILALRGRIVDRSDLIAVIVSGEDAATKALTLSDASDGDSTGAAMIFAGLFAAETEQYDLATALINAASMNESDDRIVERLSSWGAAFSLRAGYTGVAERFRRIAVEKALALRDIHQVRRLEDFGERIEWKEWNDVGV
jgi:tetratricopeptide (TPR) repeat protein